MFDHEYLLQLITNSIEENPELEYKSAAALQREDKKVMEITKDVSSFAIPWRHINLLQINL